MARGDLESFREAFAERGIAPLPLAISGYQTVGQVEAYQAVLYDAVRLWRFLAGHVGANEFDDWPRLMAGPPLKRLRAAEEHELSAARRLLGELLNPGPGAVPCPPGRYP